MTIKKETTAFDFLVNDAWEVDENLSTEISDNNLVDAFNSYADDCFPEGCTETELNDWLRFDDDAIRAAIGLEIEED